MTFDPSRRALLRRMVAGAAGLLVAPDALELIVPERKIWPGHSFDGVYREGVFYGQSFTEMLHEAYREVIIQYMTRESNMLGQLHGMTSKSITAKATELAKLAVPASFDQRSAVLIP